MPLDIDQARGIDSDGSTRRHDRAIRGLDAGVCDHDEMTYEEIEVQNFANRDKLNYRYRGSLRPLSV
ncbi:hypothetical protein BGY98DRAFT_954925, partial [Russula aff. rugulosa BPL654]